jgi:aryl-alcohol dehydrogenase-like predicted oxidoreductase
MLDSFFEQGGTFLDSAKVYNDWIPGEASRSEKVIGKWLKQRGNRSQVIVATKGAHPDLSTMNIQRLSPAEIASDLDACLSHLQVDCIDLYYLHRDDPPRPVQEIIDTLASLVKAGKIRYYGCSNWRLERIQAAQVYAQSQGLPGFAAVQNMWNLAYIRPEAMADPTIVAMDEALWQFHRENNLAAIPFTSQANGLFQKLEKGGTEALSSRLRAMYINPVSERRYANLKKLQAGSGLTTTQIVLGYLMSQPFPTIPIIGPHSPAQLSDSLSAADVKLTPEQVASLLA